MNADDVARSWVGTPYLHQASIKGAGADCLGLIRGVWRELCGAEPETVPVYTPDWDEAQRTEVLLSAARRNLKAAPLDWRAGQVLLFRMRAGAVAKHLGILSTRQGYETFIHAYTGHGVVESPLSAPWRRRVIARFEFQKDGV